MEYTISKTSNWKNDSCPCEGAVWKENKNNDKYSNISNWTIEINSLKELQDFITKIDCNIIMTEDSIEIYDDYRE